MCSKLSAVVYPHITTQTDEQCTEDGEYGVVVGGVPSWDSLAYLQSIDLRRGSLGGAQHIAQSGLMRRGGVIELVNVPRV